MDRQTILQPTGTEPIPLNCPHCGARQLFLGFVHVHPAEGHMDAHLSLIDGEGHEHPTDGPQGAPLVGMHLQCLACDGWAWLILCSGMDDGSWLRFTGCEPPV